MNETAIGEGGSLSTLEHYVTLTKDNNLVHLKQPFKGLIITTNNSGTTIYKRTNENDGKETITLENGENKFTDWNYGFYFSSFMEQDQITSFDFSKYDTSNVTDMSYMFNNCINLTSLDLSSFDTSNVTYMNIMFKDCSKLTYIKCKKEFKDWCLTNQGIIDLPTVMRDGGGGTWDIV